MIQTRSPCWSQVQGSAAGRELLSANRIPGNALQLGSQGLSVREKVPKTVLPTWRCHLDDLKTGPLDAVIATALYLTYLSFSAGPATLPSGQRVKLATPLLLYLIFHIDFDFFCLIAWFLLGNCARFNHFNNLQT